MWFEHLKLLQWFFLNHIFPAGVMAATTYITHEHVSQNCWMIPWDVQNLLDFCYSGVWGFCFVFGFRDLHCFHFNMAADTLSVLLSKLEVQVCHFSWDLCRWPILQNSGRSKMKCLLINRPELLLPHREHQGNAVRFHRRHRHPQPHSERKTQTHYNHCSVLPRSCPGSSCLQLPIFPNSQEISDPSGLSQ